MYKNFKLTETEKHQILEMHKSHGYKRSINEIFGATWLTKIKIDSPEKLSDEQKHEMATKFSNTWNGLVAIEFEPGEWYNREGKIDDIKAYEEHVNNNVYGEYRKSPYNAEFEAGVKRYHRNTPLDSEHQYKLSSYDELGKKYMYSRQPSDYDDNDQYIGDDK
jgi:hypothetical protein